MPEYTKSLKIYVDNDRVSKVIDLESGDRVKKKILDQQKTLTQWYQLILDSMKNKHGEVKVEFTQKSPFVSSIYIDQHRMRAHDEYTVFIKNFIIN